MQKKQIGPRTVPWGIPDRTGDQLDDEPFTTTHCTVFYHLKCGLEEEPCGGSVKGVDLTTDFKNACSLMNDLN